MNKKHALRHIYHKESYPDFCGQVRRRLAIPLMLLFFFLALGTVNAQVTVSPGSNPATIVPMGDSIVFPVSIYSGTAYPNGELEVTVPAGFELLTTTPNLKPGSLSPNKLKGRIVITNLLASVLRNVNVYAKPLCDAKTAVPDAQRVVKYAFFTTATAPAATTSNATNPNVNFNDPILNIGFPASKSVSMGVSETRVFTLIQTRNFSHINSLQITAACDPAGFLLSKIEVSKNGTTWTTLPTAALTSSASGYVYTITQANTFSPLNYAGKHLNYGDTLLIRETVTLQTCEKGTLNYFYKYGDGTTFCDTIAEGDVTYSEPNYVYTPDIWTTSQVHPNSPANDGLLRFAIRNNSVAAEATMHEMFVNVYYGGYTYEKAFFVTSTGAVDGFPTATDTVFIPWRTATKMAMFDSLRNPAMASWYAARGLSSLDGDGVYNDLEKGNTVYFAVTYNYILNTNCSQELKTHDTRRADLYYKTFCRTAYNSFTRPYWGAGSTNFWEGGFAYASLQNISLSKINLHVGDTAKLSFNTYYTGNGTVTGVSGSNLTNIATSSNPTSSFWTTLVLPKGLSLDTSLVKPIKIGSTDIHDSCYTVSPNLDTVKIKWTANWGVGYGITVVVKANSTPDLTKTLSIYNEYDYGNTGAINRFGCINSPIGYAQLIPCSGLELMSFDPQRTSFGYTDTTKATRVTTVAQAKALGYNLKAVSSYDNASFVGKTIARSTMVLAAGDQIRVDVQYSGINSAAQRFLLVDTSDVNNAVSVWYNASVSPIKVPASAVSYIFTAGGTHTLRADIAPYLRNAGITTLNPNDSLRIELYTRATTFLSSRVSTANVSVQMEVTPIISSSPLTCYPLVDVMTMFNADWTNKAMGGGGAPSRASLPSNWVHYATTNVNAMDLGIEWSYGGVNPYTGNEYRPNGDNFSKVTIEYPLLLAINTVWRTTPDKILGNQMEKYPMDTTEYKVSYAGGKTYLTFDSINVPKDMMSTLSASGIGYVMSFDVINYNATMNKYISYAYDNFPTSALPRRDTINHVLGGIGANGGTTTHPYKYQINALASNVAPLGSRAEWTLRITNQSTFLSTKDTLPHSWIAVECPAGVLPVELRDAITDIAVPASFVEYATNKYWIKLDSIKVNPTKDYILSCTYSICTGTPQLTVKYGMSKMDYPTDPAQGYANYNSPNVLAGVVSTNITYTPPVTKFSGRLTHTPNMASGTNKFCDTMMFNAEYSNGLNTKVSNLTLRMDLPAGFDFYSSITPTVKFGSGAWGNVESATQAGRILEIKLNSTQELDAYGTAGAFANVKFALRLSCGLENGLQLPAEFIGYSGCGKQTIVHASTVNQIKIFGLQPPPDYFIKNLNLLQSSFVGVSDSTQGEMILSGQFELAATAATDVLGIIDLPKNVTLVGLTGPGLNFTQTGRRLTAPLPSNVSIGDIRSFSLILKPENPEQWSMDTSYIYVRTGKINQMTCDGIICPLLELGAKYDSVTLSMEKLQVVVSPDVKAESRYNDPSSERVVIDAKLVNLGDVAAGRLSVELCYFNGVDYVPVSGVISGLTVSGVPANDSVAFRITANIPYTENVCSMVLRLRKSNRASGSLNPYLADSSMVIVPVPKYKISAVVDPMCQMAGNTIIGENPITDYNYLWEPADYLSRANVARPSFNYDYENHPVANDTVLKYAVSIIRPNLCVSVDTIYVPLKGIPHVQQYPDMTLCSGSPLKLEFKDTTNTTPSHPTTFSWVIENGASVGLPMSGTRSTIDAASVRNNTTQPIVLLCRVTPKKNDCDGVTKIFTITINPKPQINYMVNQSYCAGQMIAPQVLGGNMSNSQYHWEYVSGTTISGLNQGINIIPNFIAINATATPTVTNMRAYAEYDNADKICYSDTTNFTITIQPSPTVNTVGDKNICNGGNLSVNFTGNAAGSYYWQKVSGTNIPGLAGNGTGNISLTNLTNTTTSPLVAVYKVTPITVSGTCMGSEDNFTITLYPTPALTTEKLHTICNGTELNLNLTSDVNNINFSWTRLANAAINGGTAKTMGNANIREMLTSTAAAPVVVKYVVTMKTGPCSKNDTISVTVNSEVEINNITSPNAICSGTNFTFTPTATATGAAITWERLDAAGIQEAPTQGSGVLGTAKINEVLTNQTANPVMVIYLLSIEKNGCSKEQQIRVIVNPTPALSSNLHPNAICSGSMFNYTIRTQTKNAAYSWKRLANANITPIPSAVSTSTIISETLTNTSNNPVTVQYEVTTTANGCSNTEIVEAIVNPIPKLSSTLLPADVCSGEYFVYNIESNTQGANFLWNRKNNGNIAEGVTYGGSSLISEKLTNKTTSVTTVEYTIVTEANGCKNSGESVKVKVNPLPTVTITTPTPVEIAVNGTKTITSSVVGTVIGWSSSNSSVATVAQDGIDPTKAVITAVAQGIAYITLEIQNASGCKNSTTFTVNVGAEVKATLALANGAASQICNNGSTTLEVVTTGGKAPFTVVYNNGISNQTITANTSNHRFVVNPAANTGNAPATTTYTLVSVTDNGGNTITVIPSPVAIDVNPVAKITNTNILANSEFCQGTLVKIADFQTNITDKNKVSYTWSNTNPSTGLSISGQGYLPVFEAKNGYGAAIVGDIKVTAIYNGLVTCQDVTTSKSYKITINPQPDFIVMQPAAICAGSAIDLNGLASSIVQNIIPTTCITEFYCEAACLTKVIAPLTPAQSVVHYARVTESTTGCMSKTQEVFITVNAVPTVDAVLNQTLCNNDGFNVQLTGSLPASIYKWVRTDANTNVTGMPVSGTNVIYSNRLVNATAVPQTITIEVTPHCTDNSVDCVGAPMSFDITVNPTPVLSVALNAPGICSGSNPNYTLASATPGIIYYWERLYIDGIAEAITQKTGSTINETLTNLTQKTINVRYAVTMEIGNCANTQYVTVPVYPTPVLSSPLQAGKVCSGGAFSYFGQSAVLGSSIQWKRLANANIAEAASGTLAPMPINEVLTNNTTNIVKVSYQVTTTANGCANTETVEVFVEPKLALTSTTSPSAICSGKYFNYTATTASSNVQISWIREFNSDIQIPESFGNSAKINERLVNMTNAPVQVVYNVTMRTGMGCEKVEQVTVTVNALPVITASESAVTIAIGGQRAIDITDIFATGGSVTSSKPTVATATFNPVTGKLAIVALSAGYAELTYTTSNTSGCTNSLVIPVTVTAGPMATIALSGTNTVCSGGSTSVQITDIANGQAPWTIEINYVGSTAPAKVVTVSSKHELPMLVDITLPGNTGSQHKTVSYKVTNVTDGDGSARTTHSGIAAVVELPVPMADPVFDQSICNGSLTDGVYFTGSATNYRWSVDKNIGLSKVGQGNIAPFVATISQATDVEATITVIPEYTYNNVTCVGTTPMTFKIKVKASPVIIPAIETQVCSNAGIVYIPYTSVDTNLEYRLVFSDKAREAGFHNMTAFAAMPKDSIAITMAEGVEPQRYRGTIEVRHAGCTSISSYDFSIYVLKDLVITEQPVAEIVTCTGDSLYDMQVKAIGIDLTYQWYKDGQPIVGATQDNFTATEHGIYHVEVSSKCGTVASTETVIRPNRAQLYAKWDDILYVSNRDTSGNSLQFSKYQWYKEDVDGKMVAISYQADVQDYQERGGLNGTYAVEVFYTDGTSFMSCPITITPTPKTKFKVYPNPAKANEPINVSLEKAENNGYLLEVFDVNGKKVLSTTTKEEVTSLNLNVASGTYVLRITDAKGNVRSQKIIVN